MTAALHPRGRVALLALAGAGLGRGIGRGRLPCAPTPAVRVGAPRDTRRARPCRRPTSSSSGACSRPTRGPQPHGDVVITSGSAATGTSGFGPGAVVVGTARPAPQALRVANGKEGAITFDRSETRTVYMAIELLLLSRIKSSVDL